MDAFKRYFIHFSLIILVAAIILMIIVTPRISPKLLLLYFCIVLTIFVLPMSVFFSSQESTITLSIPCSNSEAVYSQILTIIESKTGRILLSKSENTSIYSIPASKIELLTKYNRWLTNDIIVVKCDSAIEVVTPQCYQKYFKIFYE